jgi:hypothetical protein
MARVDRRSHLRRRYPRSPRPQRAPDQSHRAQAATLTRNQAIQGLTATAANTKKLLASEAPDPGLHQSEYRGDIISDCPGDFVGTRTESTNARLEAAVWGSGLGDVAVVGDRLRGLTELPSLLPASLSMPRRHLNSPALTGLFCWSIAAVSLRHPREGLTSTRALRFPPQSLPLR